MRESGDYRGDDSGVVFDQEAKRARDEEVRTVDKDNQEAWERSLRIAMEAQTEIRQAAKKAFRRERWRAAAELAVAIVMLLLFDVGIYVFFSFLAQHIQ